MTTRDRLGVCQWFHFEAYEDVERSVSELRALGVRHLRTGISWADYHRPGGREFYDWQMRQLREFEVLLSVWHTPPSISEDGTCNAPPKRLKDYADFIWEIIGRYGDAFGDLELWNEPNNNYKWAFKERDPRWRKFAEMVGMAAYTARSLGKRTVLGGMIPVDHHWLEMLKEYRLLEVIDVVAIHAFPGMWWSQAPNWDWARDWKGWQQKLDYISAHTEGRPVWVTESGLSTWDMQLGRPGRHAEQVARLHDAVHGPAERLYWYNLIDLDPRREAIEGFHVDENEYHLGLMEYGGRRKPAWEAMRALLQAEESDARAVP